MALACKKQEIYIKKIIIDYDEHDTLISRNVYYDKEVKYIPIPPKIQESKYYSYELLNAIKINNTNYNTTIFSQTLSAVSSASPSPLSSGPTSPTLPNDSCIIDMSKIYN